MTLWQAFLLGIVQGVAEFLPISSSGHLILFELFLGITEPTIIFNVFLHTASLVVIIGFFWERIFKITYKEFIYLAVATIPAVAVGYFLQSRMELIFGNLKLLSLAFIITGLFNLISNKLLSKEPKEEGSQTFLSKITKFFTKKNHKFGLGNAAVIGFFQSFALIPGISRSGSTLLGGLTQNLSKEKAFNFTFLLAIPAIAGATALQFKSIFEGVVEPVEPSLLIVGGLATLVASYFSLTLLKKLVTEAKLSGFGWYCLTLGSVLAIWNLL